MDKVLVYTQSLNYLFISSALDKKEVIPVSSKYELAVKITEEDDIFCVVVQFDNLEADSGFLKSVSGCFPILPVIILSDKQGEDKFKNESICLIEYKGNKEELKEKLKNHVSEIKNRNKRESRRFKWPLKGYITFDKKNWNNYPIKSISSCGAFLESKTCPIESGKKGILRIIFKNFKMYTLCEILESRKSSSNLPDGFGVKFIRFSEPSKKIIDKIIDDALIKIITEPESEPEVPSIGTDMLLIDNFELM